MSEAGGKAELGRLQLDRDLVVFDLEATGVDPARDRIVQVAMIRVAPDGATRSLDSLVDPEMPIPPEATAIHGLRDQDVRAAPRLRDLAPKLLEFLGGCDLAGFGVARYDVPLLSNEFRRVGVSWDLSGRRVLDALTLFHRLEPRNLAAALEFYCGKRLADAHDARADARASLEVLVAQVGRYHGRPDRPDLPADARGLHEFCNPPDPRSVDARGKFVWRYGEAAFNFGKHQTRPLREVAEKDRAYVEWLASSSESSSPELARICRQALQGVFPKKPAGGA